MEEQEQSDEVPLEVDDSDPTGPDTEAGEEATRCRRCCRRAWESTESPTLTAFGLKLVEEKGKSAVIIRAVPLPSQILAWIAYFYVLASTLMLRHMKGLLVQRGAHRPAIRRSG